MVLLRPVAAVRLRGCAAVRLRGCAAGALSLMWRYVMNRDGIHRAVPTESGSNGSSTSRLSRRAVLAGGVGAAAAPLATQTPAHAGEHHPPWEHSRMRDLTWTFSSDFPPFTDGEAATKETATTIDDDGYYMQRWTIYEHTATHLDAPAHFIDGGRVATQIRLEELFVPAVVVDIRDKAQRDPDAQVTVEDLVDFERGHGRIPRGAAVLMYSGWETRASSTEEYRGTDSSGTYHFPGFAREAVQWLVEHRDVAAAGVDTLSLDRGASEDFETHIALLGADRYGLENLRNLGTIPRRGADIFVGLVPWEEGSGGPCRVIARW